MWRMEDVLRELKEEGILEDGIIGKCEKRGGLPPGFRFHPTDEELITFYLASKVFNTTITTATPNNFFLSNYYSGVQIVEVDLTRCEPWDLPERAKMGEREWYLYSLRDRKYPSGLRTNRATETGYWKATGKDRQVYASGVTTTTTTGGGGGMLIGMKKTLVFYQGRAPRGVKTRWVMHEYRLDGHFSSFRLSSKEEWVICRIFHKNGEKKSPPIIHAPPPSASSPPPPPPLSPFLSNLPPLQEPTTTSTTQAVENASSQPHYANHNLLHSLLLNPLPNFSSISGSDTIFPPLTTTATSFDFGWLQPKHKHLSTTTTAAATVTKQLQQEQWLDKICPQSQSQYFQHQYYDPLNFDHMGLPNSYTTTTTTTTVAPVDNDGDEDDIDVDEAEAEAEAAVHVDMYPSLAVAALDRMLNHNPINHPVESWSVHILP